MPVDRSFLVGASSRELTIGLSENSTPITILLGLIILDYVNQRTAR